MRNFLLLFTFLLGTMSFGQRSGNVVIYSNTGKKFYVILNGVRQNNTPETNVKVEGLTDQWYGCRIMASDNSFTLEKNIAVKPDTVITYQIIEKKGDYKLRFYSETSMGTAPATSDQTVVIYSPVENNSNGSGNTGTTEVVETTTVTATTTSGTTGTGGTVTSTGTGGNETVTTTTTVNGGDGSGTTETVNINISIDENGMGGNVSVNATGTGGGTETISTTTTTTGTGGNVSYEENSTTTTTGGNGTTTYYEETTITTTTTTTTTTGTNEGNIYADDDMTVTLDNSSNCYMSDVDFQNLKKSVQAQSFSDDQLKVANQAAKNKCMSVSQIKEIAEIFSFSEEKMSFVKAAYNNCTNQSDYYLLMEVFEFSADKEELENFLNSK